MWHMPGAHQLVARQQRWPQRPKAVVAKAVLEGREGRFSPGKKEAGLGRSMATGASYTSSDGHAATDSEQNLAWQKSTRPHADTSKSYRYWQLKRSLTMMAGFLIC